jgi:hypothetical protein
MRAEIFMWPAICSFGGSALVVGGILLRRALSISKSWPKTTGRIIEASVQRDWSRSGNSSIYVVRPKVVYQYTVGNTEYTSSHLALIETNTANEQSAQGKASKYSPGQLVDVYYNPKEPGFAVLTVGDPTQGTFPFAMIIVGVVAVIAGVIWACVIGKHQIDFPNGHTPLEAHGRLRSCHTEI